MSKAKTYGKQMPKGDARPLGTPKPRLVKSKKESPISLDTPSTNSVDFSQSVEPNAIPRTGDENTTAQERKTMTLSFKNVSKNGKNVFYTGAASVIRIPLSAFPNKQHPTSIDVADGVFAGAKQSRASMTPEERKAANAARPKLTLAEKIAQREKQLAALKAKADATAAQPSM